MTRMNTLATDNGTLEVVQIKGESSHSTDPCPLCWDSTGQEKGF